MSCADGCRRDDVPEGRVTSCPMAVKRRPVQRQRRAEALPLGGLDLSVQRCLLNRPAPSPCEPADLDAQAALFEGNFCSCSGQTRSGQHSMALAVVATPWRHVVAVL
jgi:hypothetical protein